MMVSSPAKPLKGRSIIVPTFNPIVALGLAAILQRAGAEIEYASSEEFPTSGDSISVAVFSGFEPSLAEVWSACCRELDVPVVICVDSTAGQHLEERNCRFLALSAGAEQIVQTIAEVARKEPPKPQGTDLSLRENFESTMRQIRNSNSKICF